MVVHHADLSDPRRQQDIGRFAGEPAARDTDLHDVDAGAHHADQRRQVFLTTHGFRLDAAGDTEARQQAPDPARFVGVLFGGLDASATPGATDQFGAEVDRNDDVGAHCPAQRDRHRVDQAAVHQQTSVVDHRCQQARQRDRRPHGIGHAAFPQPHLAPGEEIGRDAGERQVQLVEAGVDEILRKELHQPSAPDQAAAKADVEQRQHVLPTQALDPVAELVEVARGRRGADEGADRATADQIRPYAFGRQGSQHAKVRPSPGGAAAQRQTDARAGRLRRSHDVIRPARHRGHGRRNR